jgi:ribosomal protein S4E
MKAGQVKKGEQVKVVHGRHEGEKGTFLKREVLGPHSICVTVKIGDIKYRLNSGHVQPIGMKKTKYSILGRPSLNVK